MNKEFRADELALQRFGIGQAVPRSEDPRLIRGGGCYSDDVSLPSQVHGVFVRSPHAHGIIQGLDASAAREMPGVLAVITGEDLESAGYKDLPCAMALKGRDGKSLRKPAHPSLPRDRVRYLGEPVALVIAETALEARDAAEAIVLDIEPLPAATTPAEALAADAPSIHDDVPGNLALDYHYGDARRVEEAFARAAHVTRLQLSNNRVVVSPLEPRSALAEYDAGEERWTLHVGSQGVFGLRNTLATEILGVEPEKLRVLTRNVGGSFGMKASPFPEYVALLHAARALARPVKWTDQRSESFLSDHQGRDAESTAELALDAEGRFLAVRISGLANMGAYLTQVSPLFSTINIAKNVVSVYRTPEVEVSVRCMFTNTTPIGAYRGAGRPEGNYYMERLIDSAAAEMGLDRLELRRRNHIQPQEMPYAAASGMTYDSGEFTSLLDRAVEAADWSGFEERRRESQERGKLRGIGVGQYLEVTAPPMKEMGGIRFEPDGTVTIITGTLDYGQGHATPFAQVLHSKLGIPFERIRLLQGDSDELIAGGGTGGSKSIMASGTAILEASDKVIEKGRQIAASILEASSADIEFSRGWFTIAGTDRAVHIMDVAQRLQAGLVLPDDVPHTLDVQHVHENSPSAFPNGCHIAEVEVDAETGTVEVVRYSMVNDFGTLINPMLVEGQLHGGVVQALGQALLERTVYDADGQLLTGSYMDYALPRADDAPAFAFESRPVPATTNPLGVKGCGEAGCAGGLPAIMNAVVDALRPLGVRHVDMPATPQRVWEAIRAVS
ncbi:xanthine dehydrogenase family protein molybdopterin-binding subunit [Microvirga massiliensis]|uniref:xanthine dehydrogenase family protein molybdopterin-binding subunit n=1 Tax=Microvirga massiliensis TaxID=1033741 RepID=UPI00062BAABD|nr:xanthine dehydrogenase family protein molybdopterin-binding subunit [Microvirga massiliensis]